MALPRVLVTYNWISASVALEALDRYRAARVPLGHLALREGLLGIGPVLHILDEQLEDSVAGRNRRFGEVALSLGYLSESQLDGLLERQTQESPTLDDLLVELGALDTPQEIGDPEAAQHGAAR